MYDVGTFKEVNGEFIIEDNVDMEKVGLLMVLAGPPIKLFISL